MRRESRRPACAKGLASLVLFLGTRAATTAALAHDEFDGENGVGIAAAGADPRVENLEGDRSQLLHWLTDGGQRRVHVTSHRHVVEPGYRDVARHLDTPLGKLVHHTQSGLVVGAQDGAWELAARVENRSDDVGSSRRAVVALPGRPRVDVHAGGGRLGFECTRTCPVVWAVGTSG